MAPSKKIKTNPSLKNYGLEERTKSFSFPKNDAELRNFPEFLGTVHCSTPNISCTDYNIFCIPQQQYSNLYIWSTIVHNILSQLPAKSVFEFTNMSADSLSTTSRGFYERSKGKVTLSLVLGAASMMLLGFCANAGGQVPQIIQWILISGDIFLIYLKRNSP